MKQAFIILFFTCCVYSYAQGRKEFAFANGKIAYLVKDANELIGVEDANGKLFIPKSFIEIEPHGNTVYCKSLSDGKKKGSAIYDSEGNLKISLNDKVYVKNWATLNGKVITWIYEGLYKDIVLDENGDTMYKFRTLKDPAGFWYIKNALTDTMVVDPGKYTELSFRGDYILTKIGVKEGVLNLDGSMVIPAIQYRSIIPDRKNPGLGGNPSETRGFMVSYSSSNGFVGYLNRSGECMIPANLYTGVSPVFSNGSICQFNVKINGRFGNILEYPFKDISLLENRTIKTLEYNNSSVGQIFKSEDYEHVFQHTNDKIKGYYLNKNGMVGFADLEKKIIIPCDRYQTISDVRGEGSFFVVERMGKEGLCDKEGKEIIKPIYDEIGLRNGLIIASIGLMKGVVDDYGNIMVPFEYTSIYPERGTDNLKVELFGKQGVCDKKGNIIVPPLYSSTYYNSPFYHVSDGNTTGIYSSKGEMIFPTGMFKKVIVLKGSAINSNKDYVVSASNDSEEYFYYDLKGNLIGDNKKEKESNKFFDLGHKEFEKKNYKASISYYEKALGGFNDDRIYYNIGAAYYNMGHYKDAILNLQKCQSTSNSQNLRDDAINLILDSEQSLQHRRERREKAWISVINTGLGVASTLLQANSAIHSYNINNNSISTNNGGYKRDTSLDYLLDPRYAMMQVQKQNWNEYLQMTNGGQTMTYEEWFAIKAQAWAESQNSESDSYSSESSNSSSSSTSTTSSSSGRDCRLCLGTGKCNTCNGKGWFTALGIGTGEHPCPNCQSNHNGRCSSCGGTGKQ